MDLWPDTLAHEGPDMTNSSFLANVTNYDLTATMEAPLADNVTESEYERVMRTLRDRLSGWQWDLIEPYELQGKKCMLEFWASGSPKGVYCNATWDGYTCWPATMANSTLHLPCPHYTEYPNNTAHLTCDAAGQWVDPPHGNWTHYLACIGPPAEDDNLWKAMVLRDIYFYGSILSCVLLIVVLLVFCCFKSLQCNRISIHKNLVVSFIIRSIVLIVYYEPFVTMRDHSYRDIDWLCKFVTSILYYSVVASIFWMFVEGLYLHNRVAVSVFNTEAPFRIFYVIGWGSPALIVLAWATCMHLFNPKKCWNDSEQLHYTWIILGPVLVALAVNTVFLINIIRILITKLRANNTVELDQVRKAVKATVILFPLLGLTHILFFFRSSELSEGWEMAYRVIHVVFQASQGVFVAVIYCFMNSEVRLALRKRWQRYQSQRLGSKSARRRSSTTRSSTILVPLNGAASAGGNDKCRRTGFTNSNPRFISTVDDYSVTWEDELSTVHQTP